MKNNLILTVFYLFLSTSAFAAGIVNWDDMSPGEGAGTYADTLGSKINFGVEPGPDGAKALKLNSAIVQNGWCGVWRSTSIDLSMNKYFQFEVRASKPGEVELALTDAYNVQYVADFKVPAAKWTVVQVPFSAFQRNSGYTPPNAMLGHPMDLSRVQVVGIGSLITGNSVVEIGPLEAAGQPNSDFSKAAQRAKLYSWIPAGDDPWVKVAVHFDGHPFLCRLDTGSDTLVVPCSDYFLKYPPKDRVKSLGMNCSQQTQDIINPLVEFAGRDISKGGIDRMPKDMGENADIIAGLPLIKDQKEIFDFGDGDLLFGAEPSTKNRYQLIPNDVGFLEIPIEFNGNTAIAVWDTGCQFTVVTQDYYNKHKDCFLPDHESTTLYDINQSKRKADFYQCVNTQVGNCDFLYKKVVVSDLGCMEKKAKEKKRSFNEPDVFLGLNVILSADWYFDPANKQWALWTDQPDRCKTWLTQRNTFPLMKKQDGPLVDPLGFLDGESADKLRQCLNDYSKELGAQVRVVILPSEGNWNPTEYPLALARAWKTPGAPEEWIYLVYSIAGDTWNVAIRDQDDHFTAGYTGQKLNACIQETIERVKSKQLKRQGSFIELMWKLRESLRLSQAQAARGIPVSAR